MDQSLLRVRERSTVRRVRHNPMDVLPWSGTVSRFVSGRVKMGVGTSGPVPRWFLRFYFHPTLLLLWTSRTDTVSFLRGLSRCLSMTSPQHTLPWGYLPVFRHILPWSPDWTLSLSSSRPRLRKVSPSGDTPEEGSEGQGFMGKDRPNTTDFKGMVLTQEVLS